MQPAGRFEESSGGACGTQTPASAMAAGRGAAVAPARTGSRLATCRNLAMLLRDRTHARPPQPIRPITQNGGKGIRLSTKSTSSFLNSRIGSQATQTGGENPHRTVVGSRRVRPSAARLISSGSMQQNANTRKYPPDRNTLRTMAPMTARVVVRRCSEQNTPIQANAPAYTAIETTAAGNMTGWAPRRSPVRRPTGRAARPTPSASPGCTPTTCPRRSPGPAAGW